MEKVESDVRNHYNNLWLPFASLFQSAAGYHRTHIGGVGAHLFIHHFFLLPNVFVYFFHTTSSSKFNGNYIPVFVLFNGSWDKDDIYTDYTTGMVDIICNTPLSIMISSIEEKWSLDEDSKVFSISLYKEGAHKRILNTLKNDGDVQWMYNGFAGGMYNDCCLLADIVQTRTKMYVPNLTGGTTVLRADAMFTNKDDLKKVLCNMAVSQSFQFKTVKSSPKQFTACCIHDACNWYIRALVWCSKTGIGFRRRLFVSLLDTWQTH